VSSSVDGFPDGVFFTSEVGIFKSTYSTSWSCFGEFKL